MSLAVTVGRHLTCIIVCRRVAIVSLAVTVGRHLTCIIVCRRVAIVSLAVTVGRDLTCIIVCWRVAMYIEIRAKRLNKAQLTVLNERNYRDISQTYEVSGWTM